ncbi:hypothetical protein [Nostoc sp. CCY0012]|uniref:hypothetical protein n=1 Tax=Nostoc sp. CCY0012 TaxID=1056123 RepID=UPI0039C686AD
MIFSRRLTYINASDRLKRTLRDRSSFYTGIRAIALLVKSYQSDRTSFTQLLDERLIKRLVLMLADFDMETMNTLNNCNLNFTVVTSEHRVNLLNFLYK